MCPSSIPRRIMHLDMDAFFASVEQLDNPQLRGKPIAVGGGKRGVVSAASYEARAFGVRSAMPSATAARLCPQLIFVPHHMQRYSELSKQVMAILDNFSPVVEQASVDEAYLDITGTEQLFGSSEDMAAAIKQAIRQQTQLTCSVGIAPVKFLAKIASDYHKPDGIFVLRDHEVPTFLATLPIGIIPGVGKQAAQRLAKIGIRTAGDVLRYPEEYWNRQGKSGITIYRRARGLDSREVIPTGTTKAKSESAENTFREDTDDVELLHTWLFHQSERVASSLRKHGYRGRTITLKIKFHDFKQVTRSHSLSQPTAETQTIFEVACNLLREFGEKRLSRRVRLIGVSVSNFDAKEARPQQLSLLASPEEPPVDHSKRQQLDKAMDEVRKKFGTQAITHGRLFDFKKKPARD